MVHIPYVFIHQQYSYLSHDSAFQAIQVVFEKNGVLEAIEENKGYVDMSTVDSKTSCAINKVLFFALMLPHLSLVLVI